MNTENCKKYWIISVKILIAGLFYGVKSIFEGNNVLNFLQPYEGWEGRKSYTIQPI